MTLLESIRLDPIMDVAERAGRGRVFYEIFPGAPLSDAWLLDLERPDRDAFSGPEPNGARLMHAWPDTFSGERYDHERQAA